MMSAKRGGGSASESRIDERSVTVDAIASPSNTSEAASGTPMTSITGTKDAIVAANFAQQPPWQQLDGLRELLLFSTSFVAESSSVSTPKSSFSSSAWQREFEQHDETAAAEWSANKPANNCFSQQHNIIHAANAQTRRRCVAEG